MTTSTNDIDVTLVDYFAVAGYDPDIGLVVDTKYDPCHTPGESPGIYAPTFRPPLQRSFVARIINHFPQRRPGNPFSDEILHLCMPRGLRFYTEKDVPKNTMVHTFANIKEDGSRVNGTAITFYEEVKDIAICEAMAQLQQDHVREITARHNGMTEKQHRVHHPPGTVSGGTHTLPRNRRDRTKRISYYEGGGHNSLFMSRTICVLSRLPLVNSTRALLTALHKIIASPTSPHLPLESYIYWCLYEVPLPSPSMTLKIPLLDTTLVVQRPGPKELPFFDDSIGSIFEYLPVEKFIRLFSCFLLEHQILLCSKDLSRLMTVCESLLALSFPFRWQMTYAPVLPYSKLDFFEAPVPYVMGWYYEDTVPEELFQSNVCVVDLDTGRSELPEDVPVFPGARQLANDIKNAIDRLSGAEKLLTSASTVLGELDEIIEGGVKMRRKNRRPDDWAAKRMSRSFDLEDGSAISEELSELKMIRRPSRAGLQPLPLENVLRNNSTLARVAEIARRAGVVVNVENIETELADAQNLDSPVARHYFVDAKVNNAVRECVLNRFVEMFYSYEHFVIGGQGCDDRDEYEANRESMASFDKASFLSDQPDSHLAFLAAFLETQMFTTFIDSKILSQWETPDEGVILFDNRISVMRDLLGVSIVRTPTYEATPLFAATEDLISKREETTDYVVPAPHHLAGAFPVRYEGAWPVHQLNTTLLDGANLISPAPSPWRQRYPRLRSQKDSSNGNSGLQSARPTSVYGGSGLMQVESSQQIAQQQYAFVQQLLKETKAKTKRMLVDKMGKEAVNCGHIDPSFSGVEENTLVASFCDLLERIWAHGLKNKHGKSSLWNFVLQHQDFEKPGLTTRASSTSMLTPEIRGFRAPSLPPAPHHNRRAVPVDEVPAPIILSPQNNTDVLTAISDIVDSFRGAQEEPWSKSLFRAATSIVEKYKNGDKDSNGNPIQTNAKFPSPSSFPIYHPSIARARNQSVEPSGIPSGKTMKKSTSIGDFTNPSWNGSQTDVSNLGGYASVEGSPRKVRSQSRARSPDGARVVLSPLPTHVAYDLKNVLRMTEIKTDIGYARAFVRLALERKLLHKHLGALLSNSRVLRELYKPYAFVGTDEEKEQFLYYILTLNAAQFRCFTNTFTKTKMDYQVVIVTGSGRGAIPAIWVTVEGSLCSSPPIMLKPNTPLFKFDHKNLGTLSTLRIGHQQSEKPVQWFLEYVLVRNEITGQTYKFPCSKKFGEDRWFGNGEDITLERMLVAESFIEYDGNENVEREEPCSPARTRRMSSRSQTPQRERSPSNGRLVESGSRNKKTKVSEVEHILVEAVNALVKYFCSERKVKSELAHLLCGQNGMVLAIEQAFQLGRQESLLKYFRNTCPWDYIERVCSWFFELCRKKEVDKLPREQKTMIHHTLRLYRKIDAKSSLGKDGKFHVFVLLSIRDHILPGLLPLMRYSPVTADMYNEPSFLRTPAHMTYFAKLMFSLSEYNITIDPSLTYGIS